MLSKLPLFPVAAEVNSKKHLVLGGCDTVDLANEYGTPLYVFDEHSLRNKCIEVKENFNQRYDDIVVLYACKAFICKALVNLLREQGLGLDVVSGGELGIVKSAGFPIKKVYFHGNNKSAEEISLALDWGIGRVVVDNFHELAMLNEIAGVKGCKSDILLRLIPGIDPHTHKFITTGNVDSKFGFPSVDWEEAVVQAMSEPNINLIGLHFHIGSLIFDIQPYQKAIEVVLDFAAEMKTKHDFILNELNVGGGFAIQYVLDSPAPPISYYAELITSEIASRCRRLKLMLPQLVIEPGRSIVGRAGVALYRVGVVKDIPRVRRYVSVDGGMADNIRPALYEAEYEAVVANEMIDKGAYRVTIAGKYCESGDILVRDIELPLISTGDLIAIPGCGAYCVPMASNYNAAFKPAIVMVSGGEARLIRRRETVEDLTGCDLD